MSVMATATVRGGLSSSPPLVPCSCSSSHSPHPGSPQAAHVSSCSPSLPIWASMAVPSTSHVASLILPPRAPGTASPVHLFSSFVFTSGRPPVRQLASQSGLGLRDPASHFGRLRNSKELQLPLSQGLLPSCLTEGRLSVRLSVGREA